MGLDLERINKRKGGGRRFHRYGPNIEAKELVWAIVVITRGIKRSWRWEERRGRTGSRDACIWGRMWLQRYLGAERHWDLRTSKTTSNSMRVVKGSQWSRCVIKEEIWEKRGSNELSGGIEDGLDVGDTRTLGRPMSRELQYNQYENKQTHRLLWHLQVLIDWPRYPDISVFTIMEQLR